MNSSGIGPAEGHATANAKRELLLIRRRIEALLEKTEANGCTPGEAAAAFEKAEELVSKNGLDPEAFRWPPRPSTPFGSATSGSGAPKQPSAAAPSRGRGIGRLAERLIVEDPEWTYRRIAEEVNRQIQGATASEKSVQWYASGLNPTPDALGLRPR